MSENEKSAPEKSPLFTQSARKKRMQQSRRVEH